MKHFVGTMRDGLCDIDPGHEGAYRQRADDYMKELDQLDSEYRTRLSQVKRKAFVSFHSAFTHLAVRYNLEQAAVFEADAADFGPKHLEKVIQFMKDRGVKVVFAEPQFPEERLSVLARETGAAVRRLDPLGNPAVKGHDSYLALMRSNLVELCGALNE